MILTMKSVGPNDQNLARIAPERNNLNYLPGKNQVWTALALIQAQAVRYLWMAIDSYILT